MLTRLLIRMKPMRLFMMPTGYEKPCEVYFPLNPLSRIEGGPCVWLSHQSYHRFQMWESWRSSL